MRDKCKLARAALVFAPCLVLLAASVTPAREVLTPEEQVERELERKRQAEPVLECGPRSLHAEVKRGETRGLRLSIENAGGRGLHWAVISAPKWASPDRRSGELGYQEKLGVLVTLDPERLPAGETSGVIVVEGRDRDGKEVRGSPATLRVIVEVEAEKRAGPEEEGALRASAPISPPETSPPRPGKPLETRLGRSAYAGPTATIGGLGVWVGVDLWKVGRLEFGLAGLFQPYDFTMYDVRNVGRASLLMATLRSYRRRPSEGFYLGATLLYGENSGTAYESGDVDEYYAHLLGLGFLIGTRRHIGTGRAFIDPFFAMTVSTDAVDFGEMYPLPFVGVHFGASF